MCIVKCLGAVWVWFCCPGGLSSKSCIVSSSTKQSVAKQRGSCGFKLLIEINSGWYVWCLTGIAPLGRFGPWGKLAKEKGPLMCGPCILRLVCPRLRNESSEALVLPFHQSCWLKALIHLRITHQNSSHPSAAEIFGAGAFAFAGAVDRGTTAEPAAGLATGAAA